MFQEIKEAMKEEHVGKSWIIQKEGANVLVLEEARKTTDMATATFTNCPEVLMHIRQQGLTIEGCVYRFEIHVNGVTDRIGYFIRMQREEDAVQFDLLVQDRGIVQKRRAKIYNDARSDLVHIDFLHKIEQTLIDYVQELPEFRLHFATGNVG